MYPRILINTNQIIDNCALMVKKAKENHIDFVMAVVKVFAGHLDFIDRLVETGITHIADSRIDNLIKLQSVDLPKCLLRLPMISDVDRVVKYADISLNSELETIKALNLAAQKQGKKHQIILMFDLGDLREGIYYTHEYLPLVKDVLACDYIDLIGIGANLTCYGGLVPSREILNRLVDIKNTIEKKLSHPLQMISGGNSSTVTLFDQSQIPSEINSLRLGESIFFGKETSYSTPIKGFHQDNFILEAEIIECQTKPSYPDGPTSINSFGEKVEIEDKGLMKRGILAIGKQDVILENLDPMDERLTVIGGSSDHLIIDISQTDYQLGDIIQFTVNYPGFLHLMSSHYVQKVFH
jgi:predicted amino acid racemase